MKDEELQQTIELLDPMHKFRSVRSNIYTLIENIVVPRLLDHEDEMKRRQESRPRVRRSG